jgi:predicted dehydrogenase
MSSNSVRFGLVGAGGIAQAHAQAFENCAEAQCVAVADVRPEAAQALAERLRCTSFISHLDLLDATDLDAVIVCTPPASHPDVCLDFLRRGVHVLCEKPLSISSQSAQLMLDAAQQAGVFLTATTKFRYVADVIRARSLVASGTLGTVVLFENAFVSRVDMTARWNSDPAISGGGVLADNGPHSMDLMRFFLGPITEIVMASAPRLQALTVEDTVHLLARNADGVVGRIDLSWSIDRFSPSYVNIYGSQGMLSVGWKESKYRLYNAPDWVVFGSGYDKIAAHTNQLRNFARAIRGEEALLTTAEDALACVLAVERAYASLWQTPVQAAGPRLACAA